jgi:hypothetical protein
MLDHDTFSALRLGRVFAAEFLDGYPWYSAADSSYDTEYLGGRWDDELIDGVVFWYPAAGRGQLGIVDVWGCPHLAAGPVRDRPERGAAWLVPAWSANADRALEAIGAPVRLGAPEAAVVAPAAGDVVRSAYPPEWYRAVGLPADGSLTSLSLAWRTPHLYHVSAVVHSTAGLLKLEVRRPDLVRKNDADGNYDACFGDLFDEGQAAAT